MTRRRLRDAIRSRLRILGLVVVFVLGVVWTALALFGITGVLHLRRMGPALESRRLRSVEERLRTDASSRGDGPLRRGVILDPGQ